MATFTGPLGSQYQLNLDVNQASQNIAGNTSTVNWSLTMYKLSGTGRYTFNNDSWSTNINGNIYSGLFTYDFRNYTGLLLATGSTVIPHNADGTKTIGVSGYFDDAQANIGAGGASGAVALTNIPRGPRVGVAGAYVPTLAYAGIAGGWQQCLVYVATGGAWQQVGP